MKTFQIQPSCHLGFSSWNFPWFWYDLLRHKLPCRYRFSAKICFKKLKKKTEFWVPLTHLFFILYALSLLYWVCLWPIHTGAQKWYFHFILNFFSLLFMCFHYTVPVCLSHFVGNEIKLDFCWDCDSCAVSF